MTMLRTLVLSSLIISIFLPVDLSVAHAQSSEDWQEWYESYRRTSGRSSQNSDSSNTSRSSSRERYSSATQRAIDKLDDDEVEEIPIPIMFGLSLPRIYSDFGDDRDGGARTHEGQDFIAPRGAPIASPTEAVVTRTGNGSSSGITVTTRNPGGESFIYMHLDEIAEGIKAGTVLEAGDIIGFVGDTGNAKGGVTHLHFEIRDGREAIDPYPRLTREFTLEERVDGVEKYLEELDSDDAEDFARILVESYRTTFAQAALAGIDMPDEIVDELGVVAAVPVTGSARDLTIGSEGSDVTALQAVLIASDSGARAKALALAGATGYFGSLTQAALAEYQQAERITPASGYYGPLTRAHMRIGS